MRGKEETVPHSPFTTSRPDFSLCTHEICGQYSSCFFIQNIIKIGKAFTVGSAIFQPRFITNFNNPNDKISDSVVASFQGRAMPGTIITFKVTDQLGRKKCIALGSAFVTIGCPLQAGAINMVILIIGHIIAGIASKVTVLIVDGYISLCSKAFKIRGVVSSYKSLR